MTITGPEAHQLRRTVEEEARRWAAMARRLAVREADLARVVTQALDLGVPRYAVAGWIATIAGDIVDGAELVDQVAPTDEP